MIKMTTYAISKLHPNNNKPQEKEEEEEKKKKKKDTPVLGEISPNKYLSCQHCSVIGRKNNTHEGRVIIHY